ncbi:hypothetical protein F2Q69_00022429 [Brassica cretica]|uniref:Uncharacterized protein n=1 Tax=Brassica cretica TaxID=69181 RepID=A0A8S9QAL3_BRACR|nr:hypothetical protein F2Q69_00022429 [Brassica cretica]
MFVKMFEANQRRLFSQFEVQEFCDNLVEGVVKALKDDFEEKSFDYPHQGPLLDTRRPLDDGLGPIFDEEDELGPTFVEKAPSMTSINMENHLCFDPGTTPTPLTTNIQEHCEKLDLINFLFEMCVKISSQDVKRFGFDKHENGINSGFVLSFDQFLKHSKGFDHFEESLELDLQQPDVCARNSFDSFVFKENSFNLSCYRYALITGNLFASTCALDEFMVKTLMEQKSLRAKTNFCCDSVLKSDLELLYFNSDHVRHVLKMSYDISCLESILIYNTFFCKSADPWIRKETLVSDLNKYLSCTYDPGILMFVLSVQDKQDQSQRGLDQTEVFMSDHASPTDRVIRSDHSVHADHNFPLDRVDQTVRTDPSDHPDCTGDRTDGLIPHFDQFMNFEHPNFCKARILKLSDDLASIWSRSVRENHPSGHMDRTGRVLLLTAGHTAGYNESGQWQPKGSFDQST